jgi:hypothetical protein
MSISRATLPSIELADGIASCIGRMNSDQGKTRYDGRLDRWTMSNSKPDVRASGIRALRRTSALTTRQGPGADEDLGAQSPVQICGQNRHGRAPVGSRNGALCRDDGQGRPQGKP